MNNNKGNIILLTIIAVATLLVAVVGATFAYFSVSLNGTESDTTIEVTSGTLSIEYNGNSKLAGSNKQPGEVIASKEFTVTGVVTGSTNLNYNAFLKVTNNTYSDGALVYTITSTNTSSNGSTIATTSTPVKIPAGTSTIDIGKALFAGPTSSGATHKYKITVTFAKTEADQTADLNKAFEGTLQVSQTTN